MLLWPRGGSTLPVLGRCAFSAAPANAHAEVKAAVRHVTAAADVCGQLVSAEG